MRYLSRLTLRRDPGTAALRDLIDPVDRRTAKGQGRAADAHHRLIWSAFGDGPERDRDFLWRAEGRGRFYTLSARPPLPSALFEPPETKPFDVALMPGDRLRFVLRANAVASLPGEPLSDGRRARGRKVDVAMKALHAVSARDTSSPDADGPGGAQEPSERARVRDAIAQREAFGWLARQGAAHGFEPDEATFQLEGYRTVALPGHRGKRRGEPRFGVFDMGGTLAVHEPEPFVAAIAQGFGRAKAFGCGLMLIRRA